MCSPSRLLLARTALASAPFKLQISRVIARSRFSPVQTRTVVLTSRARAEMSMMNLRWMGLVGGEAAGAGHPHNFLETTLRRPRRAAGGKGARRFGARERLRDGPLPS